MITKRQQVLLTLLTSTLWCGQVFAALTLDATRYIYEEGEGFISAMTHNPSKEEYGAQVWLDNIVESDTRPSFIATPSFFRIKDESQQVFRILKVSDHMPDDKESIYWMNLQEIPPAREGSGLSMAIRTKVKLIYRPAGLLEGRGGAERGLSVEYVPGGKNLVNTTPYIFAIGTVFDEGDNAIELSQEDRKTLSMFMPGDRVRVTGHVVKAVSALDDYGNVMVHMLDKS
ncbi:fimbria/pilus periplasmic chaperone [Vibrio crassostreae]|uniref:fimbria/pilus periplasmic chaperone n=1 Tax=Vibrio crassostreae TaxID=246167 RepID=UPI0010CE1F35|nr:fimbria/pilus periplasmic chaperone [Vibrio crassostreae]TCW20768.1 P pilus assembly chaperone PapD [Vibrio crassostreae]